MDTRWELWRQDDNGQKILIRTFTTETEARSEQAELEARKHKQVYWIERRSEPPPS